MPADPKSKTLQAKYSVKLADLFQEIFRYLPLVRRRFKVTGLGVMV